MKFILAETDKFILNERFTLSEATLLEDENTISTQLSGLFTIIDNLKHNLTTNISLTILNGTPLEKNKAETEAKIKKLLQEIQELLFTKKNFRKILEPIQTGAKKKTLKNKTFSVPELGTITTCCINLTAAVNRVKPKITALNQNKIEAEDDAAVEKWIKSFYSNLTALIDAIKALYKAIGETIEDPELDQEPDQDQESDESTSNTDEIKLGLVFQKLFRFAAKTPKIFIDTNWSLSDFDTPTKQIAELKKLAYQAEKATDDTKLPTEKILWEAYYLWLWGAYADQIKDLGHAFRSQLFSLGFTTKTNYFIGYLKYLLQQMHVAKISAQAYIAIHNLVANNKLTKQHINATADKAPDVYSLALCPAILKLTNGETAYNLIEKSLHLVKKLGDNYKYQSEQKLKNLQITSEVRTSILSFVFMKQPSVDLLFAENTKELLGHSLDPDSNHYRSNLHETSSAFCYLSTKAVLKEESTIDNIINDLIGTEDKPKAKQQKDTITKDEAEELWSTIINALDSNKVEIADFLDFLALSRSKTTEIYKSHKTNIMNKFFGESSEPDLLDPDTRIENLTQYNKVIASFDIGYDTLEHFLTTLLSTIPDTFVVKSTTKDKT